MVKYFLLFLIFNFSIFAQIGNKYFVYFKDKGNNPLLKNSASYNNALIKLSEKAINRRLKELDENDLISYEDIPVNISYINVLTDLGIKVVNVLDWFN
nr:hypothetical protein [Melioribacteraceae bacterium]